MIVSNYGTVHHWNRQYNPKFSWTIIQTVEKREEKKERARKCGKKERRHKPQTTTDIYDIEPWIFWGQTKSAFPKENDFSTKCNNMEHRRKAGCNMQNLWELRKISLTRTCAIRQLTPTHLELLQRCRRLTGTFKDRICEKQQTRIVTKYHRKWSLESINVLSKVSEKTWLYETLMCFLNRHRKFFKTSLFRNKALESFIKYVKKQNQIYKFLLESGLEQHTKGNNLKYD